MSEAYLPFDRDAAFAKLSRERLLEMQAAGETILDCYRVLEKAGHNVVGRCLEHHGTFYELDHFPPGDVYDSEHHAQYYYHAHRPESGEHGHFHTFLRAKGMPEGMKPAAYSGKGKRPLGSDALCHFVAISMDRPGFPFALFTTNRWVTDESYYSADDTIAMIDRFSMDHTYPCLAVNRWITAMFRLFRPQIRELILKRDETLRNWQAAHPGSDVFEDRKLEVTSNMKINVDEQIAAVSKALDHLRLSA